MTERLWRCGHPRTPENTKPSQQCRTCHRAYMRTYNPKRPAAINKTERYLDYRMRYIRLQLPATVKKLEMLRNEAARYGMTELLGDQP